MVRRRKSVRNEDSDTGMNLEVSIKLKMEERLGEVEGSRWNPGIYIHESLKP